MDRNLALELVRVTEAAALGAAKEMGRGDEMAAEAAGVSGMAKAIGSVAIRGRVVIGRGRSPEGVSLERGAEVGAGEGAAVDLAVDPLEGTNPCASGRYNALACIAASEEGGLLAAPEVYMDKIAVGPAARGAVALDRKPLENLQAVAKALGRSVEHLTVAILDRPRHKELIDEVRASGARIRLMLDGDLAGAIATAFPETGVDVLMGVGGGPEGVIAAAALACVGGDFQGRFVVRQRFDEARLHAAGIANGKRIYGRDDLAGRNVMFAATGVTHGDLLRGVRFVAGGATTHSLVMRSSTGTVRFIETTHRFEDRPNYG